MRPPIDLPPIATFFAPPERTAAIVSSQLFRDHVYGCFISDDAGLRNIDLIGADNIMFEGDYPHSDSNWPHTRKKLAESLSDVPDDVARKIAEDNARSLFQFPRSPG